MNTIGTAAIFVIGVIAGWGLGTLMSLLIWAAFWLAIGTVLVLAVDALAGLSQRVCDLRVRVRAWLAGLWLRRAASAPVRRQAVWINI